MGTTTVTAAIPVQMIVSYTCASCGQENIDDSQEFILKGYASGTFASNIKLQERAQKSLQENVIPQLDKQYSLIQKDEYAKLKLTCECKNCGEKPLWANYPRNFALPVFVLIFSLCIGLAPGMQWVLLVSAAALAYIVAQLVRKHQMEEKIECMPPEQRPHILIHFPKGTLVDPKDAPRNEEE